MSEFDPPKPGTAISRPYESGKRERLTLSGTTPSTGVRWWDGWGDLNGSRLAALIGGVALFGWSLMMRSRDTSSVAYIIGAGSGAAAMATVIRWIWARFKAGSGPVFDPAFFVLTVGVLAALSAMGNASG